MEYGTVRAAIPGWVLVRIDCDVAAAILLIETYQGYRLQLRTLLLAVLYCHSVDVLVQQKVT
jgi:hypothetical protein